jgi:uncharacterized protein, YhcH/YjgK/YiaL family
MIIDSLSNYKSYEGLSSRFKKAFEYLASTDFSKLEPGKYEIDGTEVYASVMEGNTKLKEAGKWEAHKKYADIQFIVEGTEVMGYTYISNLEANTEYNEVKDVFFGIASGDLVTVNSGMFAVFMPQDAHMPGLCVNNPEKVKKVVVKVLV